MVSKKLSESTIERLSQYRRILLQYVYLENPHIFSHDLARTLKINPVHVRRDLMLIGVSGSFKNGYPVFHLIEKINQAIDPQDVQKLAFIGSENISSELLKHFSRDDSKVEVSAIFSVSNLKQSFDDIPVLPISELSKTIKEQNISVCILNLPDEYVESLAKLVVQMGVKKLINLTPVRLDFPKDIEIEQFDLITLVERMVRE
jgi:redox-sensing transcriptional repressor